METVRRYTNTTTITQRMVAELIDHIDVYHAEKHDGITTQQVIIHYNCVGAVHGAGSPEDPRGRHHHGNKKRRSIKLRPGPDRSMNFAEIKNAECPLQDYQTL